MAAGIPSGYFPVAPRTRLRLSGADALRYLNGQVSNDVRKLGAGRAMRACVLTVKGKLCAVVWIWKDGDALVVDSDPEVREDLAPRLERYIVADDVTLEDISDSVSGYHVLGGETSGIEIARLGVRGHDISEKPVGLAELSADETERIRIRNGVPKWGAELGENTLPHEARLDEAAVDFRKGCYVGQEVVSRVESVGRVNRILTGLQGEFPAAPASLLIDGKAAGAITSAIFDPESGKTLALSYVQSACDAAHFLVADASGACIGAAERREFPAVIA